MFGSLQGVRVVELGQLLAGPYCGTLLADHGADVIKVEQPLVGDPLREWGHHRVKGHALWWPIAARNKRSITCNLRVPEGQDIVRQLAGKADVLVENFRPGTLERWGLGWEELSAINPRLVMVRVSGYGQTGPYASRPGYASVGEAMGGLRHIVGDPSAPPSRTGVSMGDSLTAMFATIGALAAMHSARKTGQGQIVDAAIYESVLAITESLVPEYVLAGEMRERTGTILPNVSPSNLFPTAEGEYVLIAANQDSLFTRLASAMGEPELADDERYATHVARGENQAELDAHIGRWTATMATADLVALLEKHAVVVGRIFRAPEMLADPHFAAREAIVEVDHPAMGPFPMQNVVPKLSETPGRVEWPGPALGAHTDQVLAELGCDAAQRARLVDAGIV